MSATGLDRSQLRAEILLPKRYNDASPKARRQSLLDPEDLPLDHLVEIEPGLEVEQRMQVDAASSRGIGRALEERAGRVLGPIFRAALRAVRIRDRRPSGPRSRL